MSGKYNESNQSISCSVCKQCGGCQYVDIPYEKELKKKSAYLKQLFEGDLHRWRSTRYVSSCILPQQSACRCRS